MVTNCILTLIHGCIPSSLVSQQLQAVSFGDQQRFSQPDKSSIGCVEESSLDLLYKLNVPEQVGNNYKKFGTLLLKDKTGIKVDNIEEGLHGMPELINAKILQHWFQGRGLPVTWKCLLDTLKACSLNGLAGQIQTSLQS